MMDAGAFQAGDRVGRFAVQRRLGRGGTAAVYQAWDEVADREVALKIIPTHSGQRDYRHRADEEARLLSKLRHPSIAQVFDVGIGPDGAFIYVAMELLRGRTLRAVLNRVGSLSIPEALTLAVQVCDGLQAAHLLNAIHRDLKPENVFIEADNHAKIVDFGSAKFLGDVADRRRWRATPLYVSPEQLRGQAVDARTDVYAVGIMLYEMLSGGHPCLNGLDEATDRDVGWRQVAHVPPALSEVIPEIPGYVSEVVARAMAKGPAERFSSSGEFGLALRHALNAALEDARACGFMPALRELCALEGSRHSDPAEELREAPRVSGVPQTPATTRESGLDREEVIPLAANDGSERRVAGDAYGGLRVLEGGALHAAPLPLERGPLAADAAAASPLSVGAHGPLAPRALAGGLALAAQPRLGANPGAAPMRMRGLAHSARPPESSAAARDLVAAHTAAPRAAREATRPSWQNLALEPEIIGSAAGLGRASCPPAGPGDSGVARRASSSARRAPPTRANVHSARVSRGVGPGQRSRGLRTIVSGALLGIALGVGLGLIVPVPRVFYRLWGAPAPRTGEVDAAPNRVRPQAMLVRPPVGAPSAIVGEGGIPVVSAPRLPPSAERVEPRGAPREPALAPGSESAQVHQTSSTKRSSRLLERTDPLPY